MALQVVGVRLVADDGAQYIATLDKAEDAEQRVGKGATTAAKGLSFLEQAAVGAARQVGHLATNALADAGRAVLKFAVDGVRAAGDFESGMNNFASVVGGSLDEGGQSLDQFKDLFISLGRDLPVSTAEVQQAAIEMAKGGIEPATIAAGGLKQTLQFAAAGGLELADAATIAAKTIGGWAAVNATADEKAQLLAHSTDLLARAANASTVNVDELALGLYNVQGTARATGASLDETVTTLALLAPNFNSSAEAGNAMKNMLLRLQPATAPAAAEMARLGLLTKDGNSAFYDAQGNFIGMRATADKLQKALGGLSQAQKTQALRTIFGNDALNAANTLLEKGVDGYDAMTASLAKQLGVAEQAKLKQQGFNTSVDNLMGSLEALQITVGTGLLPTLTGLIGVLAGGVNAITDYAAATIAGTTALSTIAGAVNDLALPALYGLTAAVTAHAIMTTTISIPAIIAQTQAWIANTAAVALAALPYVAIGAAIAVVMLKYNEFNEQITTATDAVLEQKPFWTDSAAAIADYGNQSAAAAEQLQPLADNITNFRDLIHGEIEDLGKREAAYAVMVDQYNLLGIASGITADQLATYRAQLDADLATINQHAEGLAVATKAYQDEQQAIIDTQAASMTATAEAERLRGGTAALGEQASLTAEDIEKLGKKIEDTYAKGAEAVQGYASNQSSFLADVEARQSEHAAKIEELESKKNAATTADQKAAIDEQIKQANQLYKDQETAAAASYAAQQAAQKRHLGQLLIDYTVGQAALGNISKEKAAEITGALERSYGLQESSVASTFLKMAGSIDSFSKDATGDVDDLTKTLDDQARQAADTQKAMDAYAKTYTADAVANFVERKGEADDYVQSLENIPEQVTSTLELPQIDERKRELDMIDGGIRRIPKEVTIRVRVKDDVPDEYKPGSPTPFEVGIRGIKRALDDLAKGAVVLPGVASSLNDMTSSIETLLQRSDAPEEAEDLGGNILEGLIDGIAENIGRAVAKGRNAIDQVIDGMNDAAGVESPSTVTADTGANIGLGLIVGLEGMLPDISSTLAAITAVMIEGINDMDDAAAQETQDLVDTIVTTLDGLGGQVSDVLIGAFSGVADIFREQAGAIDLLERYANVPSLQADVQAQLVQAGAEAGAIQDPQQAAAFLEARTRQIQELADLQQQSFGVGVAGQQRIDEEHARKQAQLEQDRAGLLATNAANDRTAAEDLAALRLRLAAATNDVERGYIQQEIQAREAAQTTERARLTQQLTLNEQAQVAEQAHYQAALRQNYTLAAAERTRIEQRIALIEKAQEAELAALQEERAQGGNMQELIDSIQAILDSIPPQNADAGPNPIITALFALLTRLSGIQSFASGGRYPVDEPFMVGEDGPEILRMDRPGTVTPMAETRQAMQPAPMGGSSHYGGATINLGGITINGSGLGESALRGAIFGAVNDVARASDLRIRTGVR